MPRKAKENIDEVEKKSVKKTAKVAEKVRTKKASTQSVASKKVTTQSKKSSKVAASKSVTTKKSTAVKKEADKKPKKVVSKASSTSKKVAKKTVKEELKLTENKTVKKAATKKAPAKKTTAKKVTTEKAPAKKATAKKAATKKATAKKVTTEKAPAKKATAKASTVKKVTTKKASTKKSSSKKSVSKKEVADKKKSKSISKVEVLEYYDLPYRYNQTVVKVLAQTPNTLFVYWDISDSDKKQYIEKYGEYFFNNTKPILIVHNKNKNYSFEVEINDFANSWYLHVADSNCDYQVELGRKPINQYVEIKNDYLYITSSNDITTQNDHILFDRLSHIVYFRNVKTNQTIKKDISNFSLLQKIGKFDIKEFYKKLYPDEVLDFDRLDLRNPSSGNPSSSFK